MEKIVIDLENGLRLVVERNTKPYDKEVGVYLEKDGNYQDIVRVSPGAKRDDKGVLSYDSEKMIMRAYLDADSEDFTRQWVVPVREELL